MNYKGNLYGKAYGNLPKNMIPLEVNSEDFDLLQRYWDNKPKDVKEEIEFYCRRNEFTNSFNQIIEEYKSKKEGYAISCSGSHILSNIDHDKIEEYIKQEPEA